MNYIWMAKTIPYVEENSLYYTFLSSLGFILFFSTFIQSKCQRGNGSGASLILHCNWQCQFVIMVCIWLMSIAMTG